MMYITNTTADHRKSRKRDEYADSPYIHHVIHIQQISRKSWEREEYADSPYIHHVIHIHQISRKSWKRDEYAYH